MYLQEWQQTGLSHQGHMQTWSDSGELLYLNAALLAYYAAALLRSDHRAAAAAASGNRITSSQEGAPLDACQVVLPVDHGQDHADAHLRGASIGCCSAETAGGAPSLLHLGISSPRARHNHATTFPRLRE